MRLGCLVLHGFPAEVALSLVVDIASDARGCSPKESTSFPQGEVRTVLFNKPLTATVFSKDDAPLTVARQSGCESAEDLVANCLILQSHNRASRVRQVRHSLLR
jgi:hypothetical protein